MMNFLPSDLPTWDRHVLIDRWRLAFGQDPPKNLRSDFLRLAIAWQIQAGPGKRPRICTGKTVQPLTPGTRLMREWQGKSYSIQITATGYEYAGKRWRSLSAIARSITGTAWSGPAFFGLKTRKGS